MFSGRKKSRFSIIDPFIRRKRQYHYMFRIFQVLASLCVTILFYCSPAAERRDLVIESCYPSVTMLLFFRILTKPDAKISFYYNLYVNTVSTALYSVVGTLDLYNGLKEAPSNKYLHYARLYVMLVVTLLIIGDLMYIEFIEKNVRIFREEGSVGDASRARAEVDYKKYLEALQKREEEDRKKEEEEKKKQAEALKTSPLKDTTKKQ